MSYVAFILCFIFAAVLLAVSLLIIAISVARGQHISQQLRWAGGLSQIASFAVGAAGYWFVSGTSIGALPCLVGIGVGIGAVSSWGFLADRKSVV